MMAVEHLGYIVGAYAVTIGLVAILFGWIVVEGRRLKARLARLESRHGGRRSRREGDR